MEGRTLGLSCRAPRARDRSQRRFSGFASDRAPGRGEGDGGGSCKAAGQACIFASHQDQIRFYPCDLTDAEAVSLACRSFQPEALIHVAAHPDSAECFQQAQDAVAVNLVGTMNVLEAVRLSGGSLFIYGDTCKVYGELGGSLSRVHAPTAPELLRHRESRGLGVL